LGMCVTATPLPVPSRWSVPEANTAIGLVPELSTMMSAPGIAGGSFTLSPAVATVVILANMHGIKVAFA
jgi:hypothetical protein